MLPLRQRILPILCVLLGAPVTAEFLQAYQTLTGDLGAVAGAIVFLAPLYGGAALLIREITVRARKGWTTTLILAAAFGLAMQGIVDLSMFGEEAPDVPYWAELREPTMIPGLDVSAFATISWATGHMMMSVGAPLALLYALAPAHRGRPLLGWVGIPALVAAGTVIAVQIHIDGRGIFGLTPSAGQMIPVVAAVGAIAALAITPVGKPVNALGRSRTVSAALVVIGAAILKVSLDLLPSTWLGVAAFLGLLLLSGMSLRLAACQRRWGPREIGMLGIGVVIGGILIGFLAPLPPGVTAAAKLAQNAALLVLAGLLLILTVRRTRRRVAEDPQELPVGRRYASGESS